jgi:hypothetical protein
VLGVGDRANRQADLVAHQVLQQGVNRAESVELLEDQADHLLDLLVWINRQFAGGQAHVAHGRMVEQVVSWGVVCVVD